MEIEFWRLLTIACLVWYAGVTVYVAVRGAWDIKTMLSSLSAQETLEPADPPAPNAE